MSEPKTVSKGVRLTPQEVEVVQLLLYHFPDVRSEADLLYQAVMRGLLVLATQARRPGGVPFGGYAPDDLAALLAPRLAVAQAFLAEHGYAVAPGTPPAPPDPAATPPPPPAPLIIDPSAADAVLGLGGDFLD